jgi:catechol 2,3-dioxygenase-like lactoylglutathione lyase family enzyme
MISVSVSVDVPNLAEGVGFYCEAFGFSEVAERFPGLAVLRAGSSEICSDPFGHGFCLIEHRTKK